ncbi:MAG: nucleotidyltransferase [Blastocatellia bacterium]|nr:nucleotidyltransferase [Blastocatellia bacterium]
MNDLKLPELFPEALRSLFEWLDAERTPGTSIGGVAVSLIAQPRATQDIDAVIWLEEREWGPFLETGKKHGIIPRINDALDFARKSRVLLLKHDVSGINIDISMGGLEFEREMIERSTRLLVGGLSIRIPTPEDLLITKAVAQRPKDMADIDAILIAVPDLDLARVRYWVQQFADALEMPEIADNLETKLRHHSSPPPLIQKTAKKSRKAGQRKKQP